MRLSLLFLGLSCCILAVTCFGGLMLGQGRWLVLNIMECEDNDQYEFMIEKISRKKMNRTHDCFSLHSTLENEINENYGVEIEIYQKVDGGFKFYQKITDGCACNFIKTHAEENFVRMLTMANVDPPDCPIPSGAFKVDNFVMDYSEMPANGVYGTYQAVVYLMYAEEKLGCVQLLVNFQEQDEEDDSDY